MNLDLMGQRHPLSHVHGIATTIHLNKVPLHRLSILLRFESVDHDAILDVRIVANVQGLPLSRRIEAIGATVTFLPNLTLPMTDARG